MASRAGSAVEQRSQLRHGLDLLEVELPGGEGREVRGAFCDGRQPRTDHYFGCRVDSSAGLTLWKILRVLL